jgi:5'-nucleotidase/UDP-sugar diphosphatase
MRNRMVTFATATLVTSTVFLASCSPAPESREITAPPALESHELTIIGLGDIHGQLDSYASMADMDGDGTEETVSTGGISRIARLIRSIEEENPGTVAVVFSGDALSDLYFHTFKGRAIYGLMSEAGYEISVFGNHEFDKGPVELARALRSADFEFICTDLAVEGTPLDGACAPFLIENYDGLSVGYFSLITEGLPYLSSPGDLTLSGGNVVVAQHAVQELRDRGADVIVALTHVGLERDVEIAGLVPGIDIIFGGHSHSYVDEPIRVGDTFIVAGGERGTHLMRLDLETDAEGRLDTRSVGYEMLSINAAVPGAGDIEERLAVYRDSLPEAVVLGVTEVAWDLSSTAVRGGESTVANLVNDRMRDKFGVDIVLNNAGAFRGKKVYEPGPVTDVMLRSIDEFGNDAIMMTLDGSRIMEILERSAANFGEGGLLHASGLRYTIDMWKTQQQLVQDPSDGWIVTVPGERVSDVQVAAADGSWQPLDTEMEYRVLSNSFLVEKDGDGYFWFGKYGRDRENTYSTFYSILEEIVNKEGVLNPEEPDGRLKVNGM